MHASRLGPLIGNRDYSPVLHSCTKVEQRMKIDKVFAEELNSIEHAFKLKG